MVPKSASYIVASINVLGENASKRMHFRMKTHQCGQVKTKRNASVGENRLQLKMKTETSENTLVWPWPQFCS